MDPEIKQELFISRHKTAIFSTLLLVIMLPVITFLPRLTTQYQQYAKENLELSPFQQQIADSTNLIPSILPYKAQTSTPHTILALNICLHGIGNCGDNAATQSAGNLNPLHTSHQVSIDIFNINNQLIKNFPAVITYIPSLAKFTSTIDTDLPTGSYYIKISTQGYLPSSIPGIQNLIANQSNMLPALNLTAGDTDHNNILNTEDYKQLMKCYDQPGHANPCSPEDRALADLNDDGSVNSFDYNLLMRETSTRP